MCRRAPTLNSAPRMDEALDVPGGTIGELLWNVPDAVLVCRPGRVVRGNPAAEAMLGLSSEEATAAGADLRRVFGTALEELWALVVAGSGRSCLDCAGGTGGVLDAVAWRVYADERPPTIVVLRDVTTERRHTAALRRLNALARELVAEPSLEVLLMRIVDAAKDLARADLSALLLGHEGAPDQVAHFVHDAPPELFPERVPGLVRMLARGAPTGGVVRTEDVRRHSAAAGIAAGIPVDDGPIAGLLAAPVLVGDEVAGELVVANRVGRPGFDEVDEAVVTELAAHTGVAVSLVTARHAREELDAAREGLLDVALHNIRTPLTVAKGFLATLRSHGGELSPEDREHAFDAIARAHDRIHRLAEGALLDDPLISAGPPPPPVPPVLGTSWPE